MFCADGRRTVEQFARAHRLDAGELRRRHAASGLIRCGGARLKRPLKEATPYELGASAGAGPARFVARGHVDWGDGREMSIEACRMRDALESGAEGTREFAFDCAAALGASGAALLDPTGARLMAIFVGFRSAEPDARLPFSPRNYNFAVTLEGAFRRAVEVAAAAETAAK